MLFTLLPPAVFRLYGAEELPEGHSTVQRLPGADADLLNRLFPLFVHSVLFPGEKRTLSRQGADDPVPLQKAVGLLHRVGVDAQLLGHGTYRRKLSIPAESPCRRHFHNAAVDLVIDRQPAFVIDAEHSITSTESCCCIIYSNRTIIFSTVRV